MFSLGRMLRYLKLGWSNVRGTRSSDLDETGRPLEDFHKVHQIELVIAHENDKQTVEVLNIPNVDSVPQDGSLIYTQFGGRAFPLATFAKDRTSLVGNDGKPVVAPGEIRIKSIDQVGEGDLVEHKEVASIHLKKDGRILFNSVNNVNIGQVGATVGVGSASAEDDTKKIVIEATDEITIKADTINIDGKFRLKGIDVLGPMLDSLAIAGALTGNLGIPVVNAYAARLVEIKAQLSLPTPDLSKIPTDAPPIPITPRKSDGTEIEPKELREDVLMIDDLDARMKRLENLSADSLALRNQAATINRLNVRLTELERKYNNRFPPE